MAKPKVISLYKLDKYESRFLNIPTMGKPVDLFLECLSYDLKIPVEGSQERILDIFEETILKMVNLKKCTKEEMSNVLCLPKDLINFILIRLQENGYLKDVFTLAEKGINILSAQEKQRIDIEYVHGKLFMIKKIGLVLPYIHIGEFVSEDVIENTGSSITLGYGSAGNLKKVYGKCIRNNDFDKKQAILPQSKIRKAISTFNKLSINKGKQVIKVNEEYSIESSISDNVYIHLQAVVQEGNVDELLISDGFVTNIDGLTEYIEKEKSQLLHEIKSRAVSMRRSETEDGEVIEYRPHKYDEVVKYYYSIKKYVGDVLPDNVTIDELKEQSERNRHAFVNCYSLLEWAFYYYTKKNILSEKMFGFLKSQSTYSNADTILKMANKLGIRYGQKCRRLFTHIEKSNIISVYNYNKPNLYICLPIAIAEASENANSEMHVLIRRNPGFLLFLSSLNSVTGDLRHDSMKDAIDCDANEAFEKTMRIVTTLLTDLDVSDGMIVFKHDDNISKTRLLAQVSLEKVMGSIYYNTLHDNIKNEWQKVSPDKTGRQLPDPFEYLQILSRLLEASLYEALNDIKKKDKYSKNEALDIISKRYGTKLPKSLIKVNEGFYKKVVNNEKATLGAYILVYLALVEDVFFIKLKQNNFLQLVDDIVSLREHANNISLIVDEQKLNKMRDCTMVVTRIIGGYYG